MKGRYEDFNGFGRRKNKANSKPIRLFYRRERWVRGGFWCVITRVGVAGWEILFPLRSPRTPRLIGFEKTKPKPGFGRKSEARNTKFETRRTDAEWQSTIWKNKLVLSSVEWSQFGVSYFVCGISYVVLWKNKANLWMGQIGANSYLKGNYGNKPACRARKNKANFVFRM